MTLRGALAPIGVNLQALNFGLYVSQLGRVQRVTDSAAGSMVGAARAAQMQVAQLNALAEAAQISAQSARLQEQMVNLQNEAMLEGARFAQENAQLREDIRTATGKGVKESLRQQLFAQREEQREFLFINKEKQAAIREEMAAMRARAAVHRESSQDIRRGLKQEAADHRVAEQATRQHTQAMLLLGAAMVAVGAPMLALTKSFIAQAAETERFATAAEVASRARGETAETIAREREELDELYVSAQRANRTMQQLAISNVGMEKASDLMTAAMDLSVGSTLKLVQVQEILTQAVTTATTVRLRELGVVVQRGRIMQWYADQIGKERDALTAVEERLAVHAYLMRIAQGMQGAFAAQLEKTSGQLVVVNFYLTKIRETLGKHLLPAFNKILKVVISVIEWFEKLPEPVQKIISFTIALSGVVLTLVGTFLLLKPLLGAVGIAMGTIPSLFGKAAVGIGVGTVASKGFLASILAFPLAIKAAASKVTLLTRAIKTNFGGLRDLWDRTFGAFLSSVRKAFVDSLPWIQASISLIVDAITWPFKKAFEWLDRVIRSITADLVKDDWGFEFDPERFFIGAASLMGGFAAGLVAGFNQYVLTTIVDIVGAIADFLGGSLPTKGPLAHIKTSGIEIIQAWSQGMESVSLKHLRKLAREVAGTLQEALYLIQDTLWGIETQERTLAKALYPFEDALFLARAAADLVLIPLEQQNRAIQRQVEELEKVAEIERERAEEHLRILKAQAEAMKKVVEADQERLEVIDHEIFMEEQRLKTLGLTTSTRLLQLKGEKRTTEDNLKTSRASLETTEEQISVEEERLEQLVTAAEAQIEALQAQIEATNANIELERERVLLAEEALRMEEARQAQAILALIQERRFWEEENRLARQYQDILGRIPPEKKMRKKAEKIKKTLSGIFDFPELPELDIGIEKVGTDIEALKEKLLEAFMAPINEQIEETRRILDEELGPAFDRLAEVLPTIGEIESRWIRMTIAIRNSWSEVYISWIRMTIAIRNSWSEVYISFIRLTTGMANEWRWYTTVLRVNFEYLIERWNIGLGLWRDFFVNTWKGISAFFQGVWSGIMRFFARAGQFFVNAWSTVAQFSQGLWTSVSEFFVGVWTEIVTFFQGVADWFVARWQEVVAFFQLSPEEMGRATARLVLRIKSFIDGILLAIGVFAVNTVSTVIRWIGELIPKLVAKFLEIGTSVFIFLAYLEENWRAILSRLPGILLTIIRAALPEIIKFLGGILTTIKNVLGGIVSAALAIGFQVFKFLGGILTTIKNVLGGIVSAALAIGFQVFKFFVWLKDQAIQGFLNFLTGFLLPFLYGFLDELTGGMIKRLILFFAGVLVDLNLFIRETLVAWIIWGFKMAKELGLALAAWIAKFVNWLFVEMPKFWVSAVTEFLAQFRHLFNMIAAWFEVTGIPEMIQHGKDTLGELVGAAAQWIVDNITQITDIGKGFLDGIKKGIKDNWESFKSWAIGQLGGLIGGALEFFGIGSPAKALVPIGAAIVEGMQVGFEQRFNQWLPQLQATLSVGLDRAVSMPVGSQAAGNTYNYNHGGSTYQVSASYARTQSEASIRDDIRMMMALGY